MDATPSTALPASAPVSGTPEPWVVVAQGRKKVSGPMTESAARAEASRLNGPTTESQGEPVFAAKQVLFG